MMGFSRMKTVYEYTHFLHSRKIITGNVKIVPDNQVYHSKKSSKPANKYPKEIP